MAELDSVLHAKLRDLCAEGDRLADEGKYDQAIAAYSQAWKLIPEPATDWHASTWILAAIGDASFRGGYYTSAMQAFEYAMRCPDAIGNPFLHLRLGQCYLEKGVPDSAADQLTRAYMAEGKQIFESEDEKYFEFLKTRIRPPVSGEW
jgi:tetratricopeptide (TPR) repeat protein